MAENAVIGALRVVLGADTAEFETGLKSAAAKLGVFAGAGAAAGQALARVVGGAIGDVASAIPAAIKSFDSLSKSSQRIGLPVEQLAAYRHAADLSDVSTESLDKGIAKLARSVVDAAQGSTTAVAAYRALGLQFRDSQGNLRSVGDLLPDIADRFANMQDGTAKTALAMQLFGRAGADLIPLLNAGSSGLKETADEAKRLGLIIGTDTAVTAENFNDNLTRLSRVTTGLANQVAANVLPALAKLSQFLLDSAMNSGAVTTAVNVLTSAFNGVARAAILVYDNIGGILKVAGIFVAANFGAAAISAGLAFLKMASAIRAAGIAMALFEAIRGISMRGLLLIAGIVALAAGAFDNFSEKIKSVGNWVSSFMPDGAGERITALLQSMGLNLGGLTADLNNWQATAGKSGGNLFNPDIIKTSKDALDSFIASKEKEIATLGAEAAAIGKSAFEAERMKIVAEGLAIATSNHIPITDALKKKLNDIASAYALASERGAYVKQVFDQTRTPAETYAATIERLNIAFDFGKDKPELYARGVAKAQQEFANADPYVQAFGNSITSAFDRAIDGGNKFSDVLKNLLKDLTKALANEAFKALLFGSSGDSSGGVLGSVFGGVKKLFGFANGGSFTVPVGASGGIDSQIAAFRVTPGENVSVSKGRPSLSGGNTQISFAIDARGSQQGAGDEIVRSMRAFVETPHFRAKVIDAIKDGRSRRQL